MRMFYVFAVKKEIRELYKNNPSSLFKVLDSIYYMHKEDVNYGYNLLNQIVNKIKAIDLNNQIYVIMHNNFVYSKNGNEHIINDLYKNEVSILKIKKSHLILQSNKSYNTFFNILYNQNINYFVCDFLEKDFFFIDEVKNLVC